MDQRPGLLIVPKALVRSRSEQNWKMPVRYSRGLVLSAFRFQVGFRWHQDWLYPSKFLEGGGCLLNSHLVAANTFEFLKIYYVTK